MGISHDRLKTSKEDILPVSIIMCIYGFISTICDCLAMHGIKNCKRLFLLPYMIFIPIVILAIIAGMARFIQKEGLTSFLVMPGVAAITLIYIWVELMKQWSNMVTSISQEDTNSTELPPEYDSIKHYLEEPPCYEEALKYKSE